MQLHITIAFSVILHPAFYISERLILGMHHHKETDLEAVNYTDVNTPKETKSHVSKNSVISVADIERESLNGDEVSDYKGHALKYIPLRIAIVALLALVSVLLKDHFIDLQDFVGASAISLSCIILPILFYFKKTWTSLPIYEKFAGTLVVIICTILSIYVSYLSGKNFLFPSPPTVQFHYCGESEHNNTLYYDPSAVKDL
jgi:solute carrier family 32 (vesicular inhibitory amino acid transporter)